MLSTDAHFGEQSSRTLAHVQFGGAKFGEVMTTMRQVSPGDARSWQREWITSLLFDGPGQGRVLIQQGLPLRPDWENVVRPVVDYALNRPEVDPKRLALAGWSLGGYLSLRAASGEPRLAAGIADPAMTNLWALLQKMLSGVPAEALLHPCTADPALFLPILERIKSSPELRWKILQRGYWVHGVSSLPQFVDAVRQYSNDAVLRFIRCPTFLAWEESDPLAATAPEVEMALVAPRTLVRFRDQEGAGDHCAMMGRSLFHQWMFDWLEETLAAH
jgi:pimeloyl-ACP methyl ester carboxylesterase